MPDIPALIEVFEAARRLLVAPENDYTWSSWEDQEAAVKEIDGLLSDLRSGIIRSHAMAFLFTPTGPMQEVSLSSGWGDEFVDLSDRFDQAMADAGKPSSCPCTSAPSTRLVSVRFLGMDERFGESTVLKCPDCNRLWLRYLYENEAFSRSGRWYLGLISENLAAGVTAAIATGTLERLPWYFYGGSAFEGQTGRTSGAIVF